MVSTAFVSVPPHGYGGTERVVSALVEGLVEQGHEVTLFATGDSRTRATLRYLYQEAQWPPGIMTDLNHVSWALSQIREGGFDLVHAHSAGALAFGRLLPELPLVYTLHHVRDEDLSAFYRYFPEPFYVAISAAQRDAEVELPRVEVIHHGLDPAQFEWTESAAEYVAFIGRFSEIKGPHTAIDVAGRAGLPIRVAGEIHPVDGEFGEREVVPRLSQPHVTFLGTIGTEQKRPLYRDARALVAPITWEEPFGLVFIEAMLSGCPVVAFPRGSVPELVEEGVTGFIAGDPDDMVRLLRKGGPLDGFDRRRCRERAMLRFSSERMVTDHGRYYEQALRQHRSEGSGAALGAAEA